ncbi:MAG: DUF350 domain-containing protein [Alphaproteobacteria bacterium]
MDHPINYIDTLPTFLMYFVTAIALMVIFLTVYMRVTPYNELALIKQGNAAPAITLSGSLIGFILPLCSVVQASISVIDLAIWGMIALLVQVLAFWVINKAMPSIKTHIQEGQISSAILLAVLSLAVGMINAACMSY